MKPLFILLLAALLFSAGAAWAQYGPPQDLMPYAQNVGINTAFGGNLTSQANHGQVYTIPHYNYYDPATVSYTETYYAPEPDRIYSFTLPYQSTVRLENVGGSSHPTFLVNQSGQSDQYVNTNLNLAPGTYYLAVEQGSTTLAQSYNYKLNAIRTACAPTIANPPVYGYYADGLRPSINGYGSSTVYVGGTNNTLQVSSQPGYTQLFVDFNADGDFDDASETIYATAKKSEPITSYFGSRNNLLVDNFSLSLGNPVYAGAVGKTLRLRVLVSDINGGGACGNYNTAEYLDLFVTFAGSPVGNPLTKWVRQLSDVDADQYIRTRTAPDGSVYALGRSAVPKTYSYSFGYCYALGQLSTTADPGKSSITSASNGHHGYISNLGMLNKYNKNGTLQWSLPLLSYGYDGGNGAALKVTGMAVDRFGYVYVCGTYQGNITFSLSNNLTTNSYQQYYTKGFVAKFHPSDGHQVLGWQMGANPNATSNHYNEYAYLEPTGLDVAPDGRLYVAGHFIGATEVTGVSGTRAALNTRGNYDTFLAKFSDIGTMYWVVQGGGTGNDFAYGAAADKLGGGYLLGSYEGTATFNSNQAGTTPISKTAVGGSDGFVLSVPITGQLNWCASMGGVANDNVHDICADPRGSGVVAVGGFSGTAQFGSTNLTSTGYYDAFAVRLSNTGAFQWASKAGGFGQDQAYSVRLDRQGNPMVGISFSQMISSPFGGPAITAAGGSDGAIIKLGAATGQASNVPIVVSGRGMETVLGVDTAEQGGAVAAGAFGLQAGFAGWGNIVGLGTNLNGYCYSPDTTNADGWLAKFGPTAALPSPPPPGSSRQGELSLTAACLNAWPNPSAGQVTIQASGLPEGDYMLTATDASGRQMLIHSVSAQELSEGAILPVWLAPGLYQLRVAGKSCRIVVQ